MPEVVPRRWRSLWISDVHLGTRGCQAELLLDFLDHNHADRIYLVGDILDFWKMKRGLYWPTSHGQVLRRFLELSRRGVEVIYVPGNHDEALREYVGFENHGFRIERTATHVGPDAASWSSTATSSTWSSRTCAGSRSSATSATSSSSC